MLQEFREQHLIWDKANRRIHESVKANASDAKGRKLTVQVLNDGVVEDLTGTSLSLFWKTRNEKNKGLDAFDVVDASQGIFELYYTTGMLSNEGKLRANLVLVDDLGRIVSDAFVIEVSPGIDEGAVESSDSFTALTKALVDVQNLEQNYAPRLNEFAAQLDQTVGLLSEPLEKGYVRLPNNFPKLPFRVFRLNAGEYYTDATPDNVFDWSNAVEIFISEKATTRTDGLSRSTPIRWGHLRYNLDNDMYNGDNLIITVLDDVMAGETSINFLNKNVKVRSDSPSGFSWLSRMKKKDISRSSGNDITQWSYEDGVFKATQTSTHEVLDIVNPIDTDENEVPIPYEKVTSLAECRDTKGTFYQDGISPDVYCNPHKLHKADDLHVLISTKIIDIASSVGTIVFENVGFASNSYTFAPTSKEVKIYFFDCKFYRGLQDAFAIDKQYSVYLIDTVAAYGSKDGFNYHSTTKDSLAVEINCVSYGNGKYKMLGGNTTTHSNNASTAHDGMDIVRFGGRYYDSEGPVIADVNNCYSINFEPEVGSVLPSTTGAKVGIYFDGSNMANTRPVDVPNIVVGGMVRNAHNEFGIQALQSELTYEVSVKGNRKYNSRVKSLFDYEELAYVL